MLQARFVFLCRAVKVVDADFEKLCVLGKAQSPFADELKYVESCSPM
jgi:hypothetical protein